MVQYFVVAWEFRTWTGFFYSIGSLAFPRCIGTRAVLINAQKIHLESWTVDVEQPESGKIRSSCTTCPPRVTEWELLLTGFPSSIENTHPNRARLYSCIYSRAASIFWESKTLRFGANVRIPTWCRIFIAHTPGLRALAIALHSPLHRIHAPHVTLSNGVILVSTPSSEGRLRVSRRC